MDTSEMVRDSLLVLCLEAALRQLRIRGGGGGGEGHPGDHVCYPGHVQGQGSRHLPGGCTAAAWDCWPLGGGGGHRLETMFAILVMFRDRSAGHLFGGCLSAAHGPHGCKVRPG